MTNPFPSLPADWAERIRLGDEARAEVARLKLEHLADLKDLRAAAENMKTWSVALFAHVCRLTGKNPKDAPREIQQIAKSHVDDLERLREDLAEARDLLGTSESLKDFHEEREGIAIEALRATDRYWTVLLATWAANDGKIPKAGGTVITGTDDLDQLADAAARKVAAAFEALGLESDLPVKP